MNLKALKEKRNTLINELEAMVSGVEVEARSLTEDEVTAFDTKKAEIESIDATIARVEEVRAKELGKELEKATVEVKMKVGEGGKTFGSVSTKEITVAIKEQLKIDIDKKKVSVPDAIKGLGFYEINVKLHPKVTAKMKVHVVEK